MESARIGRQVSVSVNGDHKIAGCAISYCSTLVDTRPGPVVIGTSEYDLGPTGTELTYEALTDVPIESVLGVS